MNKYPSEQINLVLSKWDPIGVGLPLSTSEYQDYIPRIVYAMGNRKEPEKCLESILNDMESGYNSKASSHKKDLLSVVDKILAI